MTWKPMCIVELMAVKRAASQRCDAANPMWLDYVNGIIDTGIFLYKENDELRGRIKLLEQPPSGPSQA